MMVIPITKHNMTNQIIHIQNCFIFLFAKTIIVVETRLHIIKKSHIGKTPENLFNSLSMCKDLTAKKLSVVFQINSSPSKRKNPNGIRAKPVEINNISIRTFLFSYLDMFFNSIVNQIVIQSMIHTRLKEKL